jgi:hypothetical protein
MLPRDLSDRLPVGGSSSAPLLLSIGDAKANDDRLLSVMDRGFHLPLSSVWWAARGVSGEQVSALLVILLACVMLCNPVMGATSGSPPADNLKEIAQQNPLIDEVARNDPDGLRNLLRRLAILTTGSRDSGPPRSGSTSSTEELAQIAINPLLSLAYNNDPAATVGLLRATNAALDRAHVRGRADARRRLALVIGNSGDTAWGTLATPANDARLIASTLAQQHFELFGGHAWVDLDRRQMLQVIRDFSQAISPDTTAVIYYAGHGVQLNGRNFLVPVNSAVPRSDQEFDRNLVPVDDVLLRQMEQAGGRLNIVVLDACEDRPARSTNVPAQRAAHWPANGFMPTQPGVHGTIIMSSTAPNDVARDYMGNGADSPFAAAFAAAIGEPGLEVRDVFDRVSDAVDRATDHRQRPWISYAATEKFYFGAETGAAMHVPNVAIDEGPFRCPRAGTKVTLDLAAGALTGTYRSSEPTDPAVCRIITSTGDTKAFLYNFYDMQLLQDQAPVRAAMESLLSRGKSQVEFEVFFNYLTRFSETWTRIGTEMLRIDGQDVRTVKFERSRRPVAGSYGSWVRSRWLVWYDPTTCVFVRSEPLRSDQPGLGNGDMPGVFKVISLAPN